MTGARARAAGLAGWWVLAGATFWLDRLGDGPLGGVPWSHPEDYLTWWRARGPLLASFGTARQVLFWIGGYLGALWLLALLAGAGRTVRFAGVLAGGHLPGLRFALVLSGAATWTAVNAGPATALTSQDPPGSGPPAASSMPAPGPPVLRYVGPAGPPVLRYAGPPTTPTVPGRSPDPTRVPGPPSDRPPAPPSDRPPTPPSAPPTTPAQPSARPPTRPSALPPARPTVRTRSLPPAPQPPAESSGPVGRWWTVRPGDSLWSIAAATLSRAWGRPPDAAPLARYWWQVVEANRARLPNPADPNLLFPGDRVMVPTPPAPPAGGQPPD